jgi:carboxypeptidase C (cathepsin A)
MQIKLLHTTDEVSQTPFVIIMLLPMTLTALAACVGLAPLTVNAHPYTRTAAIQHGHFLTNKTAQFAVDGANLPDIPFDIGESYAGVLPTGEGNGHELFFWFVPSLNSDANKEITIWLNGGPGCSSLTGFIEENGPISWQAGQLAPIPNVFSWSNLTNTVWIDQPAGTGFSTAGARKLNVTVLHAVQYGNGLTSSC